MIELMITIAVLAIITSLALPSYRTILEKRRVTSGAEQVSAFLSSVQIEAVKRGEPMAVDIDEGGACVGITVGTDSCDCKETDVTKDSACLVDNVLRVFQFADLNLPDSDEILDDVTGTKEFYFDPVRGMAYTGNAQPFAGATMELVSSKNDARYALDVGLTATGRVRICSHASSSKVPGYEVCL